MTEDANYDDDAGWEEEPVQDSSAPKRSTKSKTPLPDKQDSGVKGDMEPF